MIDKSWFRGSQESVHAVQAASARGRAPACMAWYTVRCTYTHMHICRLNNCNAGGADASNDAGTGCGGLARLACLDLWYKYTYVVTFGEQN